MHPLSADLPNESDDQYLNNDDEQNIFINQLPSALNEIHDIFHVSHELSETSERLNMCLEEQNVLPPPSSDCVDSENHPAVRYSRGPMFSNTRAVNGINFDFAFDSGSDMWISH